MRLILFMMCVVASSCTVELEASDRPKSMGQALETVTVIKAEIRSAPVVSNGLAASAPTEYNLVLRKPGVDPATALDPQVRGIDIPPGGRLEIEHVDGFTRVSETIVANANVILTTGPQNPIVATAGVGPQHGDWLLEDDGSMTITIVPRNADGLTGARAAAIGVKIVHLRPNPGTGNGPAIFVNGAMGSTLSVEVRLRDEAGKIIALGRAETPVTSPDRPSIHVSNARLQTPAQGKAETIARLVESVDFQRVSPGARLDQITKTGLNQAPTFILFAPAKEQPDPFVPQRGIEGVGIRIDSENPHRGDLVRDVDGNHALTDRDPIIGSVQISGPEGATPKLLPRDELTSSGDGSGPPNGSTLIVPVQMGDLKGNYELKLSLDGGNSASVTTIVQ